jgi:tRNA uridine 5-carboxymethylaminomethyl modification enzyme
LNAAASALGRPAVEFSRTESYIGVMIDDLTTRGVTEPYRMFTSRAEFRLTVRADNADQRLTPVGLAAGCVAVDRAEHFARKMDALTLGKQRLSAESIGPKALIDAGVTVSRDGGKRTAYEALALTGADLQSFCTAFPVYQQLDMALLQQLQTEAIYDQYSDRQAKEVADLQRQENQLIPLDFDYACLSGLSNEMKAKLARARPETLLQASRLEGVTPAALVLILASLRRPQAERRAG